MLFFILFSRLHSQSLSFILTKLYLIYQNILELTKNSVMSTMQEMKKSYVLTAIFYIIMINVSSKIVQS